MTETTISVFPIKEEPELDITSDGVDDTGYENDCNNDEDEGNVNIYILWLTIRLVKSCSCHFSAE